SPGTQRASATVSSSTSSPRSPPVVERLQETSSGPPAGASESREAGPTSVMAPGYEFDSPPRGRTRADPAANPDARRASHAPRHASRARLVIRRDGADLTLHAIAGNRARDGRTTWISWE